MSARPALDLSKVTVNGAPVLTLWAAVVAERLGFEWDEALTLGRAVAGLNAQSKGRVLGIFHPAEKAASASERKAIRPGAALHIELLHRAVPAVRTPEGFRALEKDRPADPASVQRYLESKFGEALPTVKEAMKRLAKSFSAEDLGERGFALYEEFRPVVPRGVRGWGAPGVLDLTVIRSLAARDARER